MKTPAELTEMFRAKGLKVTPQRQCIFRVLHHNAGHPTAEAVYEVASAEMPTISLKTVYQTLNDLADMGEINQLDLGTGASRFDPNIDGHHHLVCTGCGKVRDLYVDVASLVVPDDQLQGFAVGQAEVVFRGLCRECARSPRSTSSNESRNPPKGTKAHA